MKWTCVLMMAAAAGFALPSHARSDDQSGSVSAGIPSKSHDATAMAGTNTMRHTDADNTGRNVRDRDDQSLTPVDQGNSETDLNMTRLIRKSIMDMKDLSMQGRNVKIITNNGRVTLRGPVKSEEEKRMIGDAAKQMAKGGAVDNQLEVSREESGRTGGESDRNL